MRRDFCSCSFSLSELCTLLLKEHGRRPTSSILRISFWISPTSLGCSFVLGSVLFCSHTLPNALALPCDAYASVQLVACSGYSVKNALLLPDHSSIQLTAPIDHARARARQPTTDGQRVVRSSQLVRPELATCSRRLAMPCLRSLALLAACSGRVVLAATPVVAAYWPAYSAHLMPPDKLNTDILTHVEYFVSVPEANGSLSQLDATLAKKFVDYAHSKTRTAGLTLGGWTGAFVLLSHGDTLRRLTQARCTSPLSSRPPSRGPPSPIRSMLP